MSGISPPGPPQLWGNPCPICMNRNQRAGLSRGPGSLRRRVPKPAAPGRCGPRAAGHVPRFSSTGALNRGGIHAAEGAHRDPGTRAVAGAVSPPNFVTRSHLTGAWRGPDAEPCPPAVARVSPVRAGARGAPSGSTQAGVFCSLALWLRTSLFGFLAQKMQMGRLPLGREKRVPGTQSAAPRARPARRGPGTGASRCDCPRVAGTTSRARPRRKCRADRPDPVGAGHRSESQAGRPSGGRGWGEPALPGPVTASRFAGSMGTVLSLAPFLRRKVPTGARRGLPRRGQSAAPER